MLFYSSDKSHHSTSEPPFFHWNKEQHSLEGRKVPKGVTVHVRVAILPPQTGKHAVKVLLHHGAVYPTGGHTSLRVVTPTSNSPSSSGIDTESGSGSGSDSDSDPLRTAHVTYHFDTKHLLPTGADGRMTEPRLLMLALPHHMRVMTQPITLDMLTSALAATCNATNSLSGSSNSRTSVRVIPCLTPIYSLKGKMTPIVGDSWTLLYSLSPAPWVYPAPTPPSAPISTSHLSAIGQALVEEVRVTYLEEPEDPYTVGKALGRLAMLALIADNLGTVCNSWVWVWVLVLLHATCIPLYSIVCVLFTIFYSILIIFTSTLMSLHVYRHSHLTRASSPGAADQYHALAGRQQCRPLAL